MPTGYTYILEKQPDVSFRDFALRCARAMGALIMLRDEPMDAPLPDDVGGSLDYELTRIAKAKERAAEVASWDAKEWRRQYAEFKASRERDYAKAREDAARWAKACRRMIDEVNRWKAPTEHHEGLRNFMLQQLEETLRFDGTPLDAEHYEVPPFAEWKAAEVARAKAEPHRAEQAYDEAKMRADDRNEWVRALKASLAPDAP